MEPEGEYYSSTIIQIADLEPMLMLAINTPVILAIACIFLLLFCSAMVSGSEVAYFSMSADDNDRLNASEKKSDKRILNLLSDKRFLLGTILVCNNLFNVAIIILSYFSIDKVLNFNASHPTYQSLYNTAPWLATTVEFLINTTLIVFILVLFGEIIPKIYARSNHMRMARVVSGPLNILQKITWPVTFLLVNSTRFIENRLLKISDQEIDVDEIEEAIDMTIDQEADKDENKILKGIINFGNISVKQIMKARVDVTAVDIESDFKELYQTILDTGFSRIPVYREDMDNIEGIIYAKDMLQYLDRESGFNWQKLIRKPFFIPENKKIDDLLREFQKKRIHLAVVVDEYGGMGGIITLEDVLEEVIGEINDEFDEVNDIEFEKLDERNYTFEGKTLIYDFCKVLEIDIDLFDEVIGDADSLAGLILEINGRMPEENEIIKHNPFEFNVLSVTNNRIEKVKITINESFTVEEANEN